MKRIVVWAAMAAVGLGLLGALGRAGTPLRDTAVCGFKVVLPAGERAFPEPLPAERKSPGFKLRGTKGWGWTPDQYLAEIPFLAKFRMNFLMNCYLSMFTDPEKLVNRWWEPIPEAKKKAYAEVVESCRKHGLDFCFAIHPQLFSERPLRYDSEEDFRDLWQHFAWMQGLGVRLFSVSYDDIAVEGQDKAALARSQARLVNRVLGALRRKDPRARMIFCPVYYWGDGSGEDDGAYLRALAGTLDPEVLVFWTGDGIITGAITAKAAEAYKRTIGHRLVIWDNYPVNDRSGALHLGPVTGRDPGLAGIAEGYMSNPLAPQNEINRVPLATCADFAWNPWDYDPARSIGQAILHLAGTTGQRTALRDLVELYPGDLTCGSTRTDYNSVVEEYNRLSARPETRPEASAFAQRVADVVARFEREFPGSHAATKATLHQHLARLGKS